MISFTSHPISGSGRGKGLGTPTINLSLENIPKDLKEGIYAVIAILDDHRYKATMHYGPRPVFNEDESCEIHLLDQTVEKVPENVSVEVIEYFRPVQNFPSVEDLKTQIAKDNDRARAILVV